MVAQSKRQPQIAGAGCAFFGILDPDFPPYLIHRVVADLGWRNRGRIR